MARKAERSSEDTEINFYHFLLCTKNPSIVPLLEDQKNPIVFFVILSVRIYGS